jgi:hypothetical protein
MRNIIAGLRLRVAIQGGGDAIWPTFKKPAWEKGFEQLRVASTTQALRRSRGRALARSQCITQASARFSQGKFFSQAALAFCTRKRKGERIGFK